MKFTEAINIFLERKIKKLSGTSPHTIDNYRYRLENLGFYLLKRRLDENQWESVKDNREHLLKMMSSIAVEDIIEDDINDHLFERQQSGACDSTVNAHLSAFSSMWTYLEKKHGIENVVKDIEGVKFKYKRQPSFTREHLDTFMEYLESEKHKTKSTFRNYIFFSTLRFYGMRISEGLGLDQPSTHFLDEGMKFEIMGKGRKPRIRTLPLIDEGGNPLEECQHYYDDLKHYIEEIRPQYVISKPEISGYLFYSEKKNRWHPDSARLAFHNAMRRLELDEFGYTPHSLRHAFVSHKLADGVPLITVSRLVDHAGIDVTSRIYAHSEEKDQIWGMTRGFKRISKHGKIA